MMTSVNVFSREQRKSLIGVNIKKRKKKSNRRKQLLEKFRGNREREERQATEGK